MKGRVRAPLTLARLGWAALPLHPIRGALSLISDPREKVILRYLTPSHLFAVLAPHVTLVQGREGRLLHPGDVERVHPQHLVDVWGRLGVFGNTYCLPKTKSHIKLPAQNQLINQYCLPKTIINKYCCRIVVVAVVVFTRISHQRTTILLLHLSSQ